MDWSEPYLKLEQSHKSLKDALNQERYDDAEVFLLTIMANTEKLYDFIGDKIDV